MAKKPSKEVARDIHDRCCLGFKVGFEHPNHLFDGPYTSLGPPMCLSIISWAVFYEGPAFARTGNGFQEFLQARFSITSQDDNFTPQTESPKSLQYRSDGVLIRACAV